MDDLAWHHATDDRQPSAWPGPWLGRDRMWWVWRTAPAREFVSDGNTRVTGRPRFE